MVSGRERSKEGGGEELSVAFLGFTTERGEEWRERLDSKLEGSSDVPMKLAGVRVREEEGVREESIFEGRKDETWEGRVDLDGDSFNFFEEEGYLMDLVVERPLNSEGSGDGLEIPDSKMKEEVEDGSGVGNVGEGR